MHGVDQSLIKVLEQKGKSKDERLRMTRVSVCTCVGCENGVDGK